MNAGGDANVVQNLQHDGIIQSWHYIYFGYSRPLRRAFAFFQFKNGVKTLDYTNINHYLSERFFFVQRDARYNNYNGQIALQQVILGTGAFKPSTDNHNTDGDIFNYAAGLAKLAPKVDPVATSTGTRVIPAATDQDSPLVQEHTLDKLPDQLNEYGYGFWFRFLTHSPQRLWGGKNAPWYFLARLTFNNPHADIGFGDRILANWQGQGYYHFTTCNAADGNPNYTQNNNFPDDIEGVWTYLYYSHGRNQKRTVGFIKYGDAAQQRIQFDVTHPVSQYAKFYLAGKNTGYPGFNGQFFKVVYRLGAGAFVDSQDDFTGLLTAQGGAPAVNWDNVITYKQADDPVAI